MRHTFLFRYFECSLGILINAQKVVEIEIISEASKFMERAQ